MLGRASMAFSEAFSLGGIEKKSYQGEKGLI